MTEKEGKDGPGMADHNQERPEHPPEHGHDHGDDNGNGFKLTVLYNGLEREISAKMQELIKALLAAAIAALPGVVNPHTLSLFTKDGRELNDDQTVHDAGVKPRDKLLLRPGAVKGGSE